MTPTPAPGLAFVRKIATVETYAASSIVIPEQARDKIAAEQWEIISVGPWEVCEDEDCHDQRMHNLRTATGKLEHICDLAPGDWVLVRKRAPVPSPEPDLWIIRQEDVIGRFAMTGQETYSCLLCGTTTPLPHRCPVFA